MIHKLKNNLKKITIGKLFIISVMMIPIGFLIPDNILSGYISLIGCLITAPILLSKTPDILLWAFHLDFLMSMRGTTQRADEYISKSIIEHLKDGKEILFGRSK